MFASDSRGVGRDSRSAARFVVTLSISLACGCGEPPGQTKPADLEMRTIENSALPTMDSSAPPTIDEELPSAVPRDVTGTAEPRTATHKAADLPFVPAISMDPVDGGKVSITPETPTVEYEGLIYHFRSEANQRLFQANPGRYLKGVLAGY